MAPCKSVFQTEGLSWVKKIKSINQIKYFIVIYIHTRNKDQDKRCPMCNEMTESIAHLMHSCRKYKDLYSRRHDRVVEALGQEIQEKNLTLKLFVKKMVETDLPHIRNDMHEIEMKQRQCLAYMPFDSGHT